jgi:mRNA-degrading endonuclease toxin of MazEF toxin-antitoxin module
MVLSHDKLNHSYADLIIIVPGTTRHRPELDKSRIRVEAEAGLPEVTYFMPDQIRVISTSRLLTRYGRLNARKIMEIEDLVRVLLRL